MSACYGYDELHGKVVCPSKVAAAWRYYGGDSAWTKAMDAFAAAGGGVTYYGGMPTSRSAIPLCFRLFLPDGSPYGGSLLRDIREATRLALAARGEGTPQ
jgi:hypothetical protein